MKLPLTNRSEVENLIPQKHPFVMLDTLLDYSETALDAGFTIPEGHIFVEDGVFQASGVLEHQAQSVALHTGYKHALAHEKAPVGYIGAVKSFTIERLPKAGDQLFTKIEIIAEMGGITLVKTETRLHGETIATSEMKTVIA